VCVFYFVSLNWFVELADAASVGITAATVAEKVAITVTKHVTAMEELLFNHSRTQRGVALGATASFGRRYQALVTVAT